MNSSNVQDVVEKLAPAIDAIADENVKSILDTLLNLIEGLAAEVKTLRTENQKLRDGNNKLKGEQGKPNIRKQTKDSTDLSSEKERHRNKKSKKSKLFKPGYSRHGISTWMIPVRV